MGFFKRRKAARKAAQLQAEKVAEIREGLHEEAHELGCSYEELMEALQAQPTTVAEQNQPKAAVTTELPQSQPEPSAVAAQPQPEPKAQQVQTSAEAVQAERKRCAEIEKMCRAMSDRIPSDLYGQLVEKGVSVDDARKVIMNAMAAEFGREEIVSTSVGPTSTGEVNPLIEDAMDRASRAESQKKN